MGAESIQKIENFDIDAEAESLRSDVIRNGRQKKLQRLKVVTAFQQSGNRRWAWCSTPSR